MNPIGGSWGRSSSRRSPVRSSSPRPSDVLVWPALQVGVQPWRRYAHPARPLLPALGGSPQQRALDALNLSTDRGFPDRSPMIVAAVRFGRVNEAARLALWGRPSLDRANPAHSGPGGGRAAASAKQRLRGSMKMSLTRAVPLSEVKRSASWVVPFESELARSLAVAPARRGRRPHERPPSQPPCSAIHSYTSIPGPLRLRETPTAMRFIAALRRWHSACRCGHHREDHQHYRRGTECGLCSCPRHRRRWRSDSRASAGGATAKLTEAPPPLSSAGSTPNMRPSPAAQTSGAPGAQPQDHARPGR